MSLPTIFIGSSTEAVELAELLGAALESSRKVNVLPWTEAFSPGYGTLEELAKRLDEVDFAAFLLLPDDQRRMRDQTQAVPRDNVVFELGLFMGKLNRDRTFALVQPADNGARSVQLPSDYAGTTYVPLDCSDLNSVARQLIGTIERLGPVARTPQGTHVVERGGRGRAVYDTIAAAVEVAEPGDVILVRPGIYTDPLIIDKPLEIIGVGVFDERNPAMISTGESTAITYAAAGGHGRLAALNVEAAGPDACAIDVTDGTLTVRSCRLTGRGSIRACLRVGGNGRAQVHGNTIADGEGVGILVCEQGYAELTDNLIVRHAHSCVEVRDGTHPRIEDNRIGDGRAGGLWLHGGSHALVERNDIYGHAMAGITITERADPTIRGNRIHDGRDAGIHVGCEASQAGGRGAIRDNDIYRNAASGVEIDDGGEPFIDENRIFDGHGGGITLRSGARGRINMNLIRGNHHAGVALLAGANPATFSRNTVTDGAAEGVYDETGRQQGDNDVRGNAQDDWVSAGAGP